jgi:hypothetical protein
MTVGWSCGLRAVGITGKGRWAADGLQLSGAGRLTGAGSSRRDVRDGGQEQVAGPLHVGGQDGQHGIHCHGWVRRCPIWLMVCAGRG